MTMYRTLPLAPPATTFTETPTHIEVPWAEVTRICGQPYGFDPSRDPCDPPLAAQQDRLIYAALYQATTYPWLNPDAPWPADASFNEWCWWAKKPRTQWNSQTYLRPSKICPQPNGEPCSLPSPPNAASHADETRDAGALARWSKRLVSWFVALLSFMTGRK